MFKKLKYKNFQAHSKYDIDLELVNTIVGPSDSGKSSLLRGLRWLCLNRPDGLDFLKHGEKFVGVKLVVDQSEVMRKKGKDSNEYHLDTLHQESGGEGDDLKGSTRERKQTDGTGDHPSNLDRKGNFKAFGQEVPESIKNILNVSQVNFQTQFEAPFWIGLSAGQLSKELNGVVDLSLIDTILARVAADLRKAKLESEVSQERLQEVTLRKKSLEWVKEANQELQALEAKAREINIVQNEINVIGLIVKDAVGVRSYTKTIKARSRELQALVDQAKKVKDEQQEWQQLRTLLDSITEADSSYLLLSQKLEQKKRELNRVTECPVCGSPLGSH